MGCFIDDSLSEKPHTDENDIVCWHYDPTSGQTIKGISSISVMYHAQAVSRPVSYHLVTKTERYTHQAECGAVQDLQPVRLAA